MIVKLLGANILVTSALVALMVASTAGDPSAVRGQEEMRSIADPTRTRREGIQVQPFRRHLDMLVGFARGLTVLYSVPH